MPTCTLSPTSAAPGEKVSVILAGYSPAFGTYNVTGFGKTLAFGQFDSKGGAITSFIVPSDAKATVYTIMGISTSALQSMSANLTVKAAGQPAPAPNPTPAPNPAPAPSPPKYSPDVTIIKEDGSKVSATNRDIGRFEKITLVVKGGRPNFEYGVNLGSNTHLSDGLHTDSQGNGSKTFAWGTLPVQNQNFNVSDSIQGDAWGFSVNIIEVASATTPKISISPTTADQGTDVNFSSSGWTPKSILTYQWDGKTLYGDLIADANGNYKPPAATPYLHIDMTTEPGPHTITMFEKATPSRKATATITVTKAGSGNIGGSTGGGNPGGNPIQDGAAALQKLILENLTWVGAGVAAVVLILLILYFRKDIAKLAGHAAKATQGAVKSAVRGR